MEGKAFCPAHITGFFKAELGTGTSQLPESIGSLGAGFSINEGVTTSVNVQESDKLKIKIETVGYQTDNIQVSKFVTKEFLRLRNDQNYFIRVLHKITVPVGYGLGCSGAVALSLAMALDKAFGTNLSKEKIGQIAHRAEIFCKTGLGDVLGSYHGGFEIRTKAGGPGVGRLERIDTNFEVIFICFSPISTKKFITEKLDSINGLGEKMVSRLITSKNCEDYQDMSIQFAKYIKVMTPKMHDVITDLHNNGLKCGVALFGETVYSIVPSHKINDALKILKKYNGIIIKSKMDNVGARVE